MIQGYTCVLTYVARFTGDTGLDRPGTAQLESTFEKTFQGPLLEGTVVEMDTQGPYCLSGTVIHRTEISLDSHRVTQGNWPPSNVSIEHKYEVSPGCGRAVIRDPLVPEFEQYLDSLVQEIKCIGGADVSGVDRVRDLLESVQGYYDAFHD